MLRTATRLLLAIVLCLNGFLMPVAMAQHHVVEQRANAAVTDASCHGDTGAYDTNSAEDPAEFAHHSRKAPSSKHRTPSCCTHDPCACGCLVSTSATLVSGVAAGPPCDVKRRDLSSIQLTASRYAVPLRPPIV